MLVQQGTGVAQRPLDEACNGVALTRGEVRERGARPGIETCVATQHLLARLGVRFDEHTTSVTRVASALHES